MTGDWAVRRPQLEPSGWAFEFENDNYPDVDDTAEVILALRGVDWPSARATSSAHRPRRALDPRHAVPGRRLGGLRRGQHPRALPRAPVLRLRRGDRSAERRRHRPRPRDARAPGPGAGARGARGARLAAEAPRRPTAPGSAAGAPTIVYGTGAAVPALVRAGLAPSAPEIRRAVRWLEGVQNEDGGFGESLALLRGSGAGADAAPRRRRRPPGRCSRCSPPTGARRRSSAASAGWSRTQREDGDWDEPEFTGTGFPGDFYIRYHLYRLVFPLMALGRHLELSGAA